jgi:hypothetical protein
MTIEEVLKEMQVRVSQGVTRHSGRYMDPSNGLCANGWDVQRWADAIEAAMREPVAWRFNRDDQSSLTVTVHPPPHSEAFKWTPLYALPPDAETQEEDGLDYYDKWVESTAEIERVRAELQGPDGFETWKDAAIDERVRRRKAETEIERLRADRDKWRRAFAASRPEKDAEIERLRKALFDISNRGMVVQREEHRIARAALAGKEVRHD